MAFISNATPNFCSLRIAMPIGLAMRPIIGQVVAFLSTSAAISSPGAQRNRLPWHVQALRPNIRLSLMPPPSSFGLTLFFVN